VKLDTKLIEFGSIDAPWGARLNDVLSRGAEFKGFDRFNKHPSIRAIVKDVIKEQDFRKALTDAEIEQIAISVANKVLV
jgi:hypothetical protein